MVGVGETVFVRIPSMAACGFTDVAGTVAAVLPGDTVNVVDGDGQVFALAQTRVNYSRRRGWCVRARDADRRKAEFGYVEVGSDEWTFNLQCPPKS